MGRSGGREDALRRALGATTTVAPPGAKLRGIPSDLQSSILDLFTQFGGVGDLGMTHPRGWDIVLGDGTVVELDERQHFTPYRAETLALPWADALPWATAYTRHCDEHAADLWSPPHLWASTKARPVPERLFGAPGARGDYEAGGSPRGKQRALFDAIRDAHALSGGVTLARLSIYDEVGATILGDALAAGAPVEREALHHLVAARTLAAR